MPDEPRPPLAQPHLPPQTVADPRRLFLHEPGWQVALKLGSTREFCYMMAPGQDFYHRLLDGEVYLFHGDERLCLACAERRGLLAYEPKGLRPQEEVFEMDVHPAVIGVEFDLAPPPRDPRG